MPRSFVRSGSVGEGNAANEQDDEKVFANPQRISAAKANERPAVMFSKGSCLLPVSGTYAYGLFICRWSECNADRDCIIHIRTVANITAGTVHQPKLGVSGAGDVDAIIAAWFRCHTRATSAIWKPGKWCPYEANDCRSAATTLCSSKSAMPESRQCAFGT